MNCWDMLSVKYRVKSFVINLQSYIVFWSSRKSIHLYLSYPMSNVMKLEYIAEIYYKMLVVKYWVAHIYRSFLEMHKNFRYNAVFRMLSIREDYWTAFSINIYIFKFNNFFAYYLVCTNFIDYIQGYIKSIHKQNWERA